MRSFWNMLVASRSRFAGVFIRDMQRGTDTQEVEDKAMRTQNLRSE